jgi:hypothetical protein
MITGPESAPAALRPPAGARPIAYIATPEPSNGATPRRRRIDAAIARAAEDFGFEPFCPALGAHPGAGTRLYARAREEMHAASGLIADLSEPSQGVAMALAWAAAEGVRTLALVPDDAALDQLTWGLLDDSRAVVVRYPATEVTVDAAARAGLPALTGTPRVDVLA